MYNQVIDYLVMSISDSIGVLFARNALRRKVTGRFGPFPLPPEGL